MEEEQQFRFTNEIRKEFEELAKNTDDENIKIQIGITINFLTALEQQLQLVEASNAKDLIDTSELYKNLNLGRDELIGLRGNNSINPNRNQEQRGGTRTIADSEFMKKYVKEYIKVEKLILTPLTKFTELVENMYTTRTIDDNNFQILQKFFNMSLDILLYILRIINLGPENNEQKFLIQNNNIQPRSVYLIIMQLFLDMIKLVIHKVNYLNDQAIEARNKQVFLALYNDWKNSVTQNKNIPEAAFERGRMYFIIEQAVFG